MILTGSIINTLAILAGSAAGMTLTRAARHFSALLPRNSAALGQRLQTVVMQGIALCLLYLGGSGAMKGQNSLIIILSMVIGSAVGEVLDLDQAMRQLGDAVQKQMGRWVSTDSNCAISEGFVTACLIFCVGAMSIVGALDSGLTGSHSMLFAKSLLDGITAVVFAASLGLGVALAAAAVFFYQASITLLASCLAPFLGEAVITEMTCVGSLMILALGLNMLGLTKIKVMNLVPAIILPVFLCRIM